MLRTYARLDWLLVLALILRKLVRNRTPKGKVPCEMKKWNCVSRPLLLVHSHLHIHFPILFDNQVLDRLLAYKEAKKEPSLPGCSCPAWAWMVLCRFPFLHPHIRSTRLGPTWEQQDQQQQKSTCITQLFVRAPAPPRKERCSNLLVLYMVSDDEGHYGVITWKGTGRRSKKFNNKQKHN